MPSSGAYDFLIRPFASSDAGSCISIFDRAWHFGHPHAPRGIDAAIFGTETKDEAIFVAEIAGAIAGFVSLYEPQGFVHHLFVDPPSHGRGIGTALLAHAVALAGGRATLKCQSRNSQALAFYRRLGWIEVAAGNGEFGSWIAMRSP